MLLAGIAVIVGMAAGLLLGRRPPSGPLRVGSWDAAAVAVGAAAGVASGASGGSWAEGLAIAAYLALGAFAVGRRAHAGMPLVAGGLASNLIVVAADGGMPVKTLAAGTVSGLHHGLSTADHLRGLADVIAVPGLDLVVSPGDVVISLGVAVAAFAWLVAPRPTGGKPAAVTPAGTRRR